MNQNFPWDFTGTLIFIVGSIMPKFHLNFNNIPAGSTSCTTKNRKKAYHLCKEPSFSHDFGKP